MVLYYHTWIQYIPAELPRSAGVAAYQDEQRAYRIINRYSSLIVTFIITACTMVFLLSYDKYFRIRRMINSLTYAVNMCDHIHVCIKPKTKISNRVDSRNLCFTYSFTITLFNCARVPIMNKKLSLEHRSVEVCLGPSRFLCP